METKIIRDKVHYEQSLLEIASLMQKNPTPGSDLFDRLQVLAVLVEKYEKEQFKFELPDPIGAIQFRMEEQGLKQIDLVPYIGSKSKVSEVLSGKRPLTIQMMRALHEGLGISAEVLLQSPKISQAPSPRVDLSKLPIREMKKRGWITDAANSAERFVQNIIAANATPVMWRRTKEKTQDSEEKMYSLYAWSARVLNLANEVKSFAKYDENKITKEFLRDVGKLSVFKNGPLLAMELLNKNGIIIIFEEHLPKTKIDGATFFSKHGNPVIALSMRYDRIDYFWFTLMHELAHIMKHLKDASQMFIDDFDEGDDESSFEIKEKEADFIAKDAFVPRGMWARGLAMRFKTADAVLQMSHELNINPAIIAGRIRKETNNYEILGDLLGQGTVRDLFTKAVYA